MTFYRQNKIETRHSQYILWVHLLSDNSLNTADNKSVFYSSSVFSEAIKNIQLFFALAENPECILFKKIISEKVSIHLHLHHIELFIKIFEIKMWSIEMTSTSSENKCPNNAKYSELFL